MALFFFTLLVFNVSSFISASNTLKTRNEFVRVSETETFVDKTNVVAAFLNCPHPHVWLTLARRFGKTVNMNSILTFLEEPRLLDGQVDEEEKAARKDLFCGLQNHSDSPQKMAICKYDRFDEYFASASVIHLSFVGHTPATSQNIPLEQDQGLTHIKMCLCAMYQSHKYLYRMLLIEKLEEYYNIYPTKKCNITTYSIGELEFLTFKNNIETPDIIFFRKFISKDYKAIDMSDVHESVLRLACLLNEYMKKDVYLLIDEIDQPINRPIFEGKGAITHAKNIIAILENAIKSAISPIKRSLLTGVAQFLELSHILHSGPNTIISYSFMRHHAFASHYGFTEKEVTKLATKFGCNNDMAIIKRRFNGYLIQDTSISIYNPFAIAHYMVEPTKDITWFATGHINIFTPFLNDPVILKDFENIAQGGTVKFKLDEFSINQWTIELIQNPTFDLWTTTGEMRNAFFSFVLQAGYLTFTEKTGQYKIPNTEIMEGCQKFLAKSGVLSTRRRCLKDKHYSLLETCIRFCYETDPTLSPALLFEDIKKSGSIEKPPEILDNSYRPNNKWKIVKSCFMIIMNFTGKVYPPAKPIIDLVNSLFKLYDDNYKKPKNGTT